jgi:hypothetical protein
MGKYTGRMPRSLSGREYTGGLKLASTKLWVPRSLPFFGKGRASDETVAGG